MSETPVFSRVDADRILKRAAQIEGSEDAGRLTLDELRSIAGEAGFGPSAVDRAIAEARVAASLDVHRPPVRRSGLLRTHLSAVREIPTEVTSAQLMRAVRLFQPYREGAPQVKLEEQELTWKDRKGIRFTVTSGAGVTEIRVFVSKFLLRRGRWTSWVKAAADRLEALVLLVVAGQDLAEPQGTPPRLAPSGDGPGNGKG